MRGHCAFQEPGLGEGGRMLIGHLVDWCKAHLFRKMCQGRGCVVPPGGDVLGWGSEWKSVSGCQLANGGRKR